MKALILTAVTLSMLVLGCGKTDEKHDTHKKHDHAEITQTKCPVMGGKIDKKLYVEHKGTKIYVCCKACIKKIKEDPDKYLKMVKEGKSAPNTHKHGSH